MNEIPIVKDTGLIKSVNVEYSENQERLSLYVPLENGDYSIGSGMEAPVWNKYTWIEGSAPFLCSEPALPIRFKLFRTVNHLFICFFMEDCGGRVQSKDTADGVVGVWSGDMAEIHFGDISPDAAWHRQLAIGIAGNRFDSCALYDAWEARSFQTGHGWGAEVKIDLANLPCSEGGFRFNLCRMSLEGRNGRYATWSRVRGGFHNIADYGELLFIDYDQTLMLRFSENRPGVSRMEYQRLAAELRTPAHAITHGPYLTNPQQGKMTISWTSAGRVAMGVEWHKVGESGRKFRKFSFMQGGIATCNSFHSVDLEELEPGAQYRYRIVSVRQDWTLAATSWRKFRAAPPASDSSTFTFFTVTDIHSDVAHLRRCMAVPAARKADFIVNLGDHLSLAMGQDALLNAVVDPVTRAASGNVDRPLIFLRGNHEFLGVFAGEFFRLMRFTNGRTWQAFTWHDTFFVVMDSGAENPDTPERIHFNNTEMLAEEMEFMQEIANSGAYRNARWRIAMMHMPPLCPKNRKKTQIFSMVSGCLVTPEAKPDVMLCGHEHRYSRLDANSNTLAPTSDSSALKRGGEWTPLPFPVIIVSNTDALETTVEKNKLTLREIAVSGDTPGVKDTFIVKKLH